MATKIGPKTVTQRDRSKALVFCVDAANYRSYRGEPTTNIVTYGYFPGTDTSTVSTGWVHSGTTKWSYRDGSQEIPYKGLGLSNPRIITFAGEGYYNDIGSGYLNKSGGNNMTVSTSTSYTLSFWFRFTGGNGSQLSLQKIRIDCDGGITDVTGNYGTAGWIPYTDVNDTEWHYYHGTITSHSSTTATQLYFYGQNYATVSGGNYFEIAAVQIEAKDHPTPFQRNDATTNERDESAGGVDQALQNISGVGATAVSLAGTYATFGQSLYKPTTRNVLATIDPNQGHIGGAYWDFDGSDEYIDTNLQPDFIHTNATVIMWFYTDDTAAYQVNGNHSEKRFYIGVNGGYFGGGVQNNNNIGAHSGKTSLTDRGIANGDWFMGTVVADSGTAKMYVNGIQDSTFAYAQSSGSNPSANFRVGVWDQGGQWWNGGIATCMIWSSALTAKEVKDIYIAQKGRFGK